MASKHELIKRPGERFLGLDIRSSDIARSPDAASTATNLFVNRSGNLVRYPGYKYISPSSAGLGAFKYAHADTSTGALNVEKVFAGLSLQKLTTGVIQIVYVNTITNYNSIFISNLFDVDLNSWRFKIMADTITVLDFDCGIGFDETTIATIGDLVTAINALTDFTATNTGSNSHPAACIPTIVSNTLSGTINIEYEYISTINQPTGTWNPLNGLYTNRNSDDFINATSTNRNNVLYVTSAFDDQVKYDSQKAYRSGMPWASTLPILATNGASGAVDVGNHSYIYWYKQVDKQGNIVEGIESAPVVINVPDVSNDRVDVTVPNILVNTGFNTDQAIVNGLQTGVNTIVTSANTLKVGDIAYFYDGASSAYVERSVTVSTPTALTISGSPVNVAANLVISANLRIVIARTLVGGADYYVLGEVPNDSSTATQVYIDLVSDAAVLAIGDQWIPPEVGAEHGLPPRGAFISTYKGLNFVCGSLTNPARFYYSDIISPEYFPPDSNSTDVVTLSQDVFTGMHPTSEYLILTKNDSSHIVVGDFDDAGFFRFRVDDISLQTGGSSRYGGAQIPDGSVLILEHKGIYRFIGQQAPQEASMAIQPFFQRTYQFEEERLVLRRTVSLADEKNELAFFFIPAEADISGVISANSNSRTLMFDWRNGIWFERTNWNMAGGAINADQKLYWCERRYATFDSTLKYGIYKQIDTGTQYDYIDHHEQPEARYTTGWETMGEPSIFKKPLYFKTYSSDYTLASIFSLRVQIEHDFVQGVVHSDFTQDFGSGSGPGGWGVDPWGEFPWGMPETPEIRDKLKSKKCQSWRVNFIHTNIYECPIISGWETEVGTPFMPFIKE